MELCRLIGRYFLVTRNPCGSGVFLFGGRWYGCMAPENKRWKQRRRAGTGKKVVLGHEKSEQENLLRIGGDPAEIRTPDTLLKRQVLCRLSYWIKCINRPKSVYRTAVQRMEVPSTNMKKMIARTFVIFASFASLVRPLFFP